MKDSFLSNISKGIGKQLGKYFENPYSKLGLGWWKMRVLKNSAQQQLRTIGFLDHSISFSRRNDFLHSLEEIFADNIYQQPYSANATIIDCGANIGLSVIYLKKLFPDSKIIAFEPDQSNFDLLKQNIAHFGFDNVDLRQEAVWIANTQLNFSSSGTLGSKIEQGNTGHSELVRATRLKDLLQQRVTFLKLDIEGAEYEVLKDVGNDIRNAQRIFIEYHGSFAQQNELLEILKLVSDNGFTYYIREATIVYKTPFDIQERKGFDVQLNIFCIKL